MATQDPPPTVPAPGQRPTGELGAPSPPPAAPTSPDQPPPAGEPVAVVAPTVPAAPEGGGPTGVASSAAVLVGLVMALAVVLASFPARNSDLWLHLATGRLLAEGDHRFGPDPFTATVAGASGLNPSWLYDLLLYGGYQALGGPALVALKALLVAALAGSLLRLCRAGESPALAAFCTALSLVALAPYLALRPVVLSYLGLALTLWLLERPQTRGAPPSFRAYWPLLLLFAVWANLDGWFWLGPLTVALSWVGGLLSRGPAAGEPAPRARHLLALVALAGLAACLLSPHHLHAFAAPARLLPPPGLPPDPLDRGSLGSPLQADYFRTGGGLLPGGLAYLALGLLGLLSFALAARSSAGAAGVWARFPAWSVFLGLSLWQARLVPFFAVVAGPVLARNLGELAARVARREAREPQPARAPRPKPGATLVVALLLVGAVLAAWPGWLQGPPYEPRRWAVEADPSLREAALQLRRWRDEGRLGVTGAGFNLSPEAAHHLAWFAPGVKSFHDGRPLAPGDVTADYLAVHQGLVAGTGAGAPGGRDWREVLRARGVEYLVVSDPSQARWSAALRRLFQNPGEWRPLYLRGRVALFGWRDPARPASADAFAGLAVDLRERASHPPPAQRAPPHGPGREPRPRAWWDDFLEPPPGRSLDRDEALLYLIHFEALRPAYMARHRPLWENSLAVLATGTAAPGGNPVPAAGGLLPLRLGQISRKPPTEGLGPGAPLTLEGLAHVCVANHIAHRDHGPPGSALLAVRAARRALASSPDDPLSQLTLGQAYLRLLDDTRERVWAARFPLLGQLRRVQAVAALQRGLRLRPGDAQAHAGLARIYRGMGYSDLTLEHLRREREALEAAGPRSPAAAEEASRRAAALAEEIRRLDRKVRDDTRLHRVSSVKLSVYERARQALARGLAGEALATLLASDDTAFGVEGTRLQLRLLLETGRGEEVRGVHERMPPEYRALLGVAAYRLLGAQLAAANGDYERADRDLAALEPPTVNIPEMGLRRVPPRTAMALGVGNFLLDRASGRLLLTPTERDRTAGAFEPLAGRLRRLANVEVLRGALALEAGEAERAEGHFRAALAYWRSEADAATGAGLDFEGRPAAEGWLQLLRAARGSPARGGPQP
jgi:hypothetical protein